MSLGIVDTRTTLSLYLLKMFASGKREIGIMGTFILKSMRNASEYFGFKYDPKIPAKNADELSRFCKWQKISRKKIEILNIFDVPKDKIKSNYEIKQEYHHNIGDVIQGNTSTYTILKHQRLPRNKLNQIVYEKGYLAKCNKDGYEFTILETDVNLGRGCPVCSSRKVVKGLNDVATTDPEIAKLFENPEDAYIVTKSSAKTFNFKCPNCGHVKKDNTNHIGYFGFSCPNCSDGISYPNKFMAKLLTDLEIKFDREVKFDWCLYPCFIDKNEMDYGLYDFVIPSLNLIIEVDGELGHGKNVMKTIRHNRRIITKEETLYRDRMKDKLAIENGFKIIHIDCVYDSVEKRFEFIKNSILNSELIKYFNFDNINFEEINNFCITNSYMRIAVNLWNEGKNKEEIADEMKLAVSTIDRYLRVMSKNNLCDYNVKRRKAS
jgi:Zn finger protein HypA/HybF involved in hydrogenase expression/very-short-patch-repair endonuclease